MRAKGMNAKGMRGDKWAGPDHVLHADQIPKSGISHHTIPCFIRPLDCSN